MKKLEINTKTKNGIPVNIKFADGENNLAIKAIAQHPQIGEISGSGDWGKTQGQEGFIITRVKIKGKYTNACFAIPKEDYAPISKELDRRKAARKAAEKELDTENKKKALTECPDNCELTRCLWTNGDLMSGEYQAEDGTKVIGPDMLENHHGWYFITKESIEEERKELERKENKKIANEKQETVRAEKIFMAAKETGKKQVLKSFSIECTDPQEECNTDIVTVWAMPDGSKTETKIHTW